MTHLTDMGIVMSRKTRAPLFLSSLSLALLIVPELMPALHAANSSDACIAPIRTAASMVTLHLVDRVNLPADTRKVMLRETEDLWRAAGVNIKWSELRAGGSEVTTTDGAHPQMTVIVTPDMPVELRKAPSPHALVMASILFIDGKPTTLIGAYPAEVQRLLETVRMDVRPVGERPAAYRHRLMGRVLGRAIAHELGHFLFGSSDHAPDGLMRARHRLDDLTSPFRRAFRVVPARPFACE
jgi:hypothetical protein